MPILMTYGDSNTHGTPPIVDRARYDRFGPGVRWPTVTQAALGPSWQLAEEGLPGRTAQFDDPVMGAHMNGRVGLRIALQTHGPIDVLTLMLGTNDLKQRFSVNALDIALSLAKLVLAIRASGCGPDGAAPGAPLLVGSSLGGYYATYLAEQHGLKALLINPAVQPHLRFDGYLGPQKNYYSDETWDLTEDHVQALAELDVAPPSDPTRYQIWLQTGDETLDYRDAERYYRACALRIQAGGDHGFQGFAERLPAIFAFAGISATLWRDTDFSVFN